MGEVWEWCVRKQNWMGSKTSCCCKSIQSIAVPVIKSHCWSEVAPWCCFYIQYIWKDFLWPRYGMTHLLLTWSESLAERPTAETCSTADARYSHYPLLNCCLKQIWRFVRKKTLTFVISLIVDSFVCEILFIDWIGSRAYSFRLQVLRWLVYLISFVVYVADTLTP